MRARDGSVRTILRGFKDMGSMCFKPLITVGKNFWGYSGCVVGWFGVVIFIIYYNYGLTVA